MIACIFHEGSGLGNQLARYVAVRCLALDKGYEFGVVNPENFKGKDFLDINMGIECRHEFYTRFNEEKVINEQGNDVRPYDSKIKDVEDWTLIDGEFQAPEYFMHHLDEIREWFKVKTPLTYRDIGVRDCVINFRGGEYVGVKDLFLRQEYWDLAISKMREIVPTMRFVVHTDDPVTARQFFPEFEIINDMERNWKAIHRASYLILSNSSFAILPALLNELSQKIITPKYWAGYNKGYWQLPQNNYKQFEYIHHED